MEIIQSMMAVIPTPSPTTVMQTMIAAMGVAIRKSVPNPIAGAVLSHAFTASKKNPGNRNSSTSPNKKLAPHFKIWCT